MFREKTLFVLGAGASAEAGLPVGAKLAEMISSLFSISWNDAGFFIGNDRDFLKLLLKNGATKTSEAAAQSISNGIRFSNSIDEYIDRHKSDMIASLGKLAIAYTILSMESASRVSVDSSNIYNSLDTQKLQGTWYLEFARALFRPVDLKSVDHLFGNLAIIDFNYDRCLSQFLRYAIRDAYSLDAADADETFAPHHHHPYGSIGDLRTTAKPNGVPFGHSPHEVHMPTVIAGIKTFTERASSEAVEAIKEEFASAHTVVFLGFGFNEQNMSLIAPARKGEAKRVIATGKYMSEDDRRIISGKIVEVCQNSVHPNDVTVRDLTCHELFSEYRLTLQAA